MIVAPSGVKVHLALGHTDMQNYVERRIMRSPAGLTRSGAELAAAALRITLGNHLPLSMVNSLSSGRNSPALRLGAGVEFRPPVSPWDRTADKPPYSEGWRVRATMPPCGCHGWPGACALRSCADYVAGDIVAGSARARIPDICQFVVTTDCDPSGRVNWRPLCRMVPARTEPLKVSDCGAFFSR
jgi:hypothetical protein